MTDMEFPVRNQYGDRSEYGDYTFDHIEYGDHTVVNGGDGLTVHWRTLNLQRRPKCIFSLEEKKTWSKTMHESKW